MYSKSYPCVTANECLLSLCLKRGSPSTMVFLLHYMTVLCISDCFVCTIGCSILLTLIIVDVFRVDRVADVPQLDCLSWHRSCLQFGSGSLQNSGGVEKCQNCSDPPGLQEVGQGVVRLNIETDSNR